MFGRYIKYVKQNKPLVHCITNYVTINDVANMILASGGNPVMAENPKEVADIVKNAQALYLNLGMISDLKLEAMINAGKCANENNIPIVFDPVGVGATQYRKDAVKRLLKEVHMTVIRGNVSEIKCLASFNVQQKGIDSNEEDLIISDTLDDMIPFLKAFSKHIGSIISVSGPIDIITDGNQAYCIYNGHPMMSRITGTGCQLSGLTASFVGANKDQFMASVAAVITMGLAGEIAHHHLKEYEGNSTYRNLIIDTVFNMDKDTIERGEKYECR